MISDRYNKPNEKIFRDGWCCNSQRRAHKYDPDPGRVTDVYVYRNLERYNVTGGMSRVYSSGMNPLVHIDTYEGRRQVHPHIPLLFKPK